MPNRNYMPSRDLALQAWSQNFNIRIGQMRTKIGLTQEQTQAYDRLYTEFRLSMLALDEEGRTKSNVIRKNEARKKLIAETRHFEG